MSYHDAAGIIFDMLKDYPRCSTCKEPATRRIEHALLIIGEQPRACDDDTHIPQVRDPSLVKFTELPQAELVRAASRYLDTHAMKTSGTSAPPSKLTRNEGEDLLRCVESAAPGEINDDFRIRMWTAVNRVAEEPVWTTKSTTFDHSTRTEKFFQNLLGYCVCEHCAKLPEHEPTVTFVVEKGGKEVARTNKLDEFLAASEAAAGGK